MKLRALVFTCMRVLRVGAPKLASIAFLVLAQSAAPVNAATRWYTGTIQQIYPLNDGSFEIATSSVLPTCSGNGANGVYLSVTPGQNAVTTSGVQSMLATVLTAFALERSVQIAYDDSTSSCYVNRLLIQ